MLARLQLMFSITLMVIDPEMIENVKSAKRIIELLTGIVIRLLIMRAYQLEQSYELFLCTCVYDIVSKSFRSH